MEPVKCWLVRDSKTDAIIINGQGNATCIAADGNKFWLNQDVLKGKNGVSVETNGKRYYIDFFAEAPPVTEKSSSSATTAPTATASSAPDASSSVAENILEESLSESCDEFVWDEASSKLFLELYRDNKPLVGKKLRSKKHLYMFIAKTMQGAPYNYKITESQVTNKDKSYQRTMKDYLNNVGPQSSGRRRKPIPMEDLVVEVYGRKHNVAPIVTVSHEGRRTQDDILRDADLVAPAGDPQQENEPQPPPKKKAKRVSLTSSSLNAVQEALTSQKKILEERNRALEDLAASTKKWVENQERYQEEARKQREEKTKLLRQIWKCMLKGNTPLTDDDDES